MPAECWGCALGIAGVGVPGEPLGVCWECGVFGCASHGRRDAGSGKWTCWPSVAEALATSAGLPHDEEQAPPGRPRLTFRGSDDFEARFPELAGASSKERARLRSGAGEEWLGKQLSGLRAAAHLDFSLAADAVGVGQFLVRERRTIETFDAVDAEGQVRAVLSGPLATLVARAPGG